VRIHVVAFASLLLIASAAQAFDRYQISVVPDTLGIGVTNPINFVQFQGELYFRGETAAHGYELFKYDGSALRLVADIAPGQLGGNVFNPVVFQDSLYFTSSNGFSGYELFKFDGSSATMVADIYPGEIGSTPQGMLEYQGKLLFSALDPLGRGLYSFDGTGITPISGVSHAPDPWLYFSGIEFGGNLLFTAYGGASTGYELYEYNGGSAALVDDIWPGNGSSESRRFTELNDKVVFSATSGVTSAGLFEYDGVSVKQIPHEAGLSWSGAEWLTVFNNNIYFTADGGPLVGVELFKYDGNTVTLVADIASGAQSSTPSDFTIFDGNLFFTASRPDVGSELFMFDGQTVSLVKDIRTGRQGSMPSFLFEFDGELYFKANNVLMRVSVIPEPRSAALGTVLLACIAFSSRRRIKVAAI
jgi:ELWxxDGT repeat protein